MAIIETQGGRITHRHLMNKTKDDLAHMCLTLLDRFDFALHLQRQREWSEETFGPGERSAGVLDHIRKELDEIEEKPHDLEEWIDVVILALDGAWRSGYTPKEIIDQLVAKQTKNENRQWPDWRTAAPGKAIEHIKEDTQQVSCKACSFSGIEPGDMDLTCFHPKSGPLGMHIHTGPLDYCKGELFRQHPGRDPDGNLKT